MRDLGRKTYFRPTERETAAPPLRALLDRVGTHFPGHSMQRVRTPDGRYRYSYASPGMRQSLGLDPGRIVAQGETDHPWVHPDDRARFVAALETSAARLATLDEELRVVGDDGRVRWVRSISHPRRLSDGTIIWDGIALDITERREAEAMLERLLARTREAEEAQSRVTAEMLPTAIAARLSAHAEALAAMRLPAAARAEVAALRATLAGAINGRQTAAPAATPAASLTARQREVARRMALGLSNREIARELGLAEGTVKLHVSAAIKRLGVRNRTEAARKMVAVP